MTNISPIQSPQYVTQPNYNAVKIDINNPEVITTPEPVKQPAYTAPMYAYPSAMVYDIPKQSIYAPQTAQPTLPIAPNAVETPVKPTPIVPPPVVIQQPPIEKKSSSAETPIAAEKQVATPDSIEVKKAENINPQIDVNAIISKLSNPDFEVQAKTMAAIATTVQASPAIATELLDVKVIDTLLGIMTKDTSSLQGPSAQQLHAREKIITGQPVTTSEQADAKTTTPMELAERNKQFSMYTVAILQKLYASEIEKTSNTVVPMTELPGAAGIVEQLKNNQNPMVRAASIDSLSYIQRPEYKQDLTTLFTIAQKDQDVIVRETATNALDKLAKIEAKSKPEQPATAAKA